MAVVAIVAVHWPPGWQHLESDESFWPSGVWTATPVLTDGTWRWLVELKLNGVAIKRRSVHRLGPDDS